MFIRCLVEASVHIHDTLVPCVFNGPYISYISIFLEHISTGAMNRNPIQSANLMSCLVDQ